MTVDIPSDLALYLQAQIEKGHLKSAEEGVLRGLELFRKRADKLAALRAA